MKSGTFAQMLLFDEHITPAAGNSLTAADRTVLIETLLTSKAQWTAWNPTTGCTKVSEACENCYADATTQFLQARGVHAYRHGFLPVFHPERLNLPQTFRSPRRIFVDAMSDLFHDAFTDQQIHDIFNVMTATPQHQYFVLTKRPERMLDILGCSPPTPNVVLGVTVEQEAYLWRAELLAGLHASFITFVNCEPLLGNIGAMPASGIDICFAAPENGPRRRPTKPEWFATLQQTCNNYGIRYIGHRFDIRADAGKRPIYP